MGIKFSELHLETSSFFGKYPKGTYTRTYRAKHAQCEINFDLKRHDFLISWYDMDGRLIKFANREQASSIFAILSDIVEHMHEEFPPGWFPENKKPPKEETKEDAKE